MGKIEQRKRGIVKRKRKSIVVIGCEGKNKTETIYLREFSSRECIIKFSTGNHTDPIGMANDLVEFIRNIKVSKKDGDEVYLLIDTDVNQNKQNQIDIAKKICNHNKIKLITSTPTFEIWYILHYGYTTAPYQNSKQVKKDLKSKIEDYTESMNVYSILKNKLDNAMANAKKLEEFQRETYTDLNNEKCNPYTGVHEVVCELIKRNKN